MDSNYLENNLPFIRKISATSIFIYIIVICVCFIYFRRINVTLGNIFGVGCAALCIYILYLRETTDMNNAEKLHDIKFSHITPSLKNIAKYADFTDFIFSIQDLYIYNPQSFENMCHAIDTFIDIYEKILLDNSLAGEFYAIAEKRKDLALDNLRSIIVMIPPNKNIIKKLNKSVEVLETLCNNYLLIIYDANNKYISENGYFNNTKIIDPKIIPYNKFRNSHMETFGQFE